MQRQEILAEKKINDVTIKIVKNDNKVCQIYLKGEINSCFERPLKITYHIKSCYLKENQNLDLLTRQKLMRELLEQNVSSATFEKIGRQLGYQDVSAVKFDVLDNESLLNHGETLHKFFLRKEEKLKEFKSKKISLKKIGYQKVFHNIASFTQNNVKTFIVFKFQGRLIRETVISESAKSYQYHACANKHIGAGNSGKIFPIIKTLEHVGNVMTVRKGEPRIVKVQGNIRNNLEKFKHENEIMQKISYLSAGKMTIFKNKAGVAQHACMFMNQIEGMDLEKIIKLKLNDDIKKTLSWMYDSLICLEEIHSKNITHNDIKPANIVAKDKAFLIDFGFSRYKDEEYKLQGSPLYVSPELWQKIILSNLIKYEPANDIYALGVTWLLLLNEINVSDDMGCKTIEELVKKRMEPYQKIENAIQSNETLQLCDLYPEVMLGDKIIKAFENIASFPLDELISLLKKMTAHHPAYRCTLAEIKETFSKFNEIIYSQNSNKMNKK